METSFKGQLSGSEIHGFHTIEDLEMEKITEEATTRWLRPNEIHAILYNYTNFTVRVKPVNLPQSGAILLFDRKMLRHFRKDGHNWKKKNDGKTVKEAHEHLKVGNEERIHVYYAHGQDNPNFVRRCYWLLDKKKEHIVLVHYRETLESQGSPMTPVNSSSSSGNSDQYRVLSEETDTGANHAFSAGSRPSLLGKSTELGDSMTVINHEMRLHEINTLEWEDLLATQNSNDSTAPTIAEVPYSEEQYQYALTNSKSNGSLFPTGYLPEAAASFSHPTESIVKNSSINVKPTTSEYLQTSGQMNTNVHSKEFQLYMGGTDGLLDVSVTDGLQTQDSFGRWMNYIMTDSPGSLDDPSLGSPISNEDASSVSKMLVQHQSHFQEQVFSITDISPSWAFSTEETKVIVIGSFQGEHSNLLCVFGDMCVPAEMIQVGVYRCMAFPHAPGVVNFYLSLDGHTPISQVLNFEYRSSSMDDRVPSPENKSQGEEFPIQMRLAHLLFSTTNSLSILSSKVSANALKEAKRFASTASSIVKEWSNLIKSVGYKETPFPQAKESLFELTLKSKLQEWLLERVVEGCKTTPRDHQGQGVIHLCAILGYTWAVYPYSRSGLSLDFRDASGWTALHWAAYYGREKMVAVLLSAGAKASLVSDPTSECPGGYTAADLASKNGHDGLGAYLAEKGLIAHFNDMYISGNISGSLQTTTPNLPPTSSLNEEEMYLNDSLTAYRTAADAASRIQAAFRENSFKQRSKAVRSTNPETEARNIIAAMKIQHAFRNYDSRKKMAAAARIQYRFRSWKIRKEFLNMRRQAIKIQAIFRGFQVRRQYRKIIWSVGVLEKAILRWRLKRKGFRGLQVEVPEVISTDDKEEEGGVEDFFRASRKQAEDRVERSVVRVQAMFRSKLAQQEYHRMKVAFDQAKLEFEEEFDPERLMKG